MKIRSARDEEFDAVAALIHLSTNHWYETHRGHSIFDPSNPLVCRLFTDVYEDLDPGCCLVAEMDDGALMGSCFYHPRETHVSLGIMNAHPDSAGLGVAGKLLREIITRAEGLPVRLVSSAMNLDSYSLYTKAGFTPQTLYQDMQFPSAPDISRFPKHADHIREATLDDVTCMADLEMRLSGIRREKDYRYFIENKHGIWRTLVIEQNRRITGFLTSVHHPASHMLGPGVFINQENALALIAAHHEPPLDSQPVFLVPAAESALITQLYHLGARNLELHVSQIHGEAPQPKGIAMPTFMPETG